MADCPLVFIVILNWNQRDDTLACLESLRKLDYDNYEVVIVDNGSTDGSQTAIISQFPDVKLLGQTANLGCAGGRNIGARYALGQGTDYILFLDNDTVVAPDFLSRLIRVAESDDRIGILGPKIHFQHDPQRVWSAGVRINFHTGQSSALDPDQAKMGSSEIYEADYVAGCALLARRIVFERIGYFDEDYFIYFEETDWCVRAKKAGYHVVVVPDSLLWHKESRSLGGASSPGQIYYMTRNAFLFYSKNLQGRRRLQALVINWLREMWTVVAYTLKPRYRLLRRGRDTRVLALRDALIGRWGKMGLDVAKLCHLGQ
jgi:GT2 family glycosyltransferase